MGPRVDSVPSDEALPTRVDVVIVGGGIIATSTALFLARKGVSVALCEKGHISPRAVEPQLGLVPEDGARFARTAAGHRESADMVGHE